LARQGDLAAAYTSYRESLKRFEHLDDYRGVGACLQGWANVVARQGAFTWAAQLWGAAYTLHEPAERRSDLFSLFTIQGEDVEDERMRAIVRTQLGEQNFVQALNEGRAMTPEQALVAQEQMLLAFQQPAPSGLSGETGQQHTPSSSLLDTLTEREREVLRLVAQGLSDAQVANILIISPRTVNAHLRSIYSKLNVTSRHAATLFALEHHLVQVHAIE
jgi:DNA-binding CsgD family transcriptional regulator